MRVGSSQLRQTDVRIIAATNRDPHAAVAAGALREDLLYRLNVFPIEMPPLRARSEDLALLGAHFLQEIGVREGQDKRLDDGAVQRLLRNRWPGNVRELRNVIQRAYVMTEGPVVSDEWLPAESTPASGEAGAGELRFPIGTSLAEVEQQLILRTLEHFDHHKERTAAALGVSLKTLYNKLKAYESASRTAPPS
jgi:DNA-binding NtrC family response regulator